MAGVAEDEMRTLSSCHESTDHSTYKPPIMSRVYPMALRLVTIAAAAGIGACTAKGGNADDSAKASAGGMVPAAPTASTADSTKTSATTPKDSANKGGMAGMGSMRSMGSMTGNPDHDFLRMMSDHHKGLILIVHETVENKEKLGVKPLASRMDKEQDAEMDKMMTMLEKDYKDSYAPKVTPEHQTMADELKSKTGSEYDRAFLTNVINHHEEAIKMIDDYLPKAKQPMLKQMAEKMKATQTREIGEMRAKLAAAKP